MMIQPRLLLILVPLTAHWNRIIRYHFVIHQFVEISSPKRKIFVHEFRLAGHALVQARSQKSAMGGGRTTAPTVRKFCIGNSNLILGLF